MEDDKEKTLPEYSINKLNRNNSYFIHELNLESIGKAIREVRKKRKLSIKELASLLNIAASTLVKVENSSRDIRLSTILKILERLNTKIFFQIELQHFWKDFNAQKKREQKLKKNKK